MNYRLAHFLLTGLLCFGAAAGADPLVEVTIAQGQVRHHVQADPSPTPGYCYWENEIPTPFFHATEADGYGNMGCPHPWLAHCDTDSLAFHGAWPLIQSTYVRSASYDVDLSCNVTLSSDTLLRARRSVSGELTTNTHTLSVVFPDGNETILLADGSGPGTAEILLSPGDYILVLHIYAYQHQLSPGEITPYQGSVTASWLDPGSVAVQSVSWDSFKSRFR